MENNSRFGSAAILLAAAGFGAILGIGSVAVSQQPATSASTATIVAHSANRLSIAAGVKRARPPEPGDIWEGCEAPRAAGTAPIYRGEPGYREEMDGDGDGIACEPIS